MTRLTWKADPLAVAFALGLLSRIALEPDDDVSDAAASDPSGQLADAPRAEMRASAPAAKES